VRVSTLDVAAVGLAAWWLLAAKKKREVCQQIDEMSDVERRVVEIAVPGAQARCRKLGWLPVVLAAYALVRRG
jgi:hypothetical protein